MPIANSVMPAVLSVEGIEYGVSGPYVHENMAVFLFHSNTQDPREFITLDEGLASGEVKVSEKAREQVNELLIQNGSAKYLFLHEGDRVRGGRQDRTVFTSLVLAPKSAAQPLPSFCIERSRWHEGDTGRNFHSTGSTTLSPKNVRSAAKVSKSQSQVWESVAYQKEECTRFYGSPNTNSSLNETMDSIHVQRGSEGYSSALSGVVKAQRDSVGIAIAINGKIEEVNLYPNHAVLGKISPRLLQSYAVQAAQEKGAVRSYETPESKTVVTFIKEGRQKDSREESINPGNSLRVQNYDNKKSQCQTVNEGRVVHWQALSGVAMAIPQPSPSNTFVRPTPPPSNVDEETRFE